MEKITADLVQAQGRATELHRSKLRALQEAAASRGEGSGGSVFTLQQLQQRRRLLDKLRPRREQLSQAELRNMGPVKTLQINTASNEAGHTKDSNNNNGKGLSLGSDANLPSFGGINDSIPYGQRFVVSEEHDALADSAEQEELLKQMEEERARQEATAAAQRAMAIERQLYFGPPDGEDPLPFEELTGSSAVSLYSHLERRSRQLASLQQSRAAAAYCSTDGGGAGGLNKLFADQQQNAVSAQHANLNPAMVLDRCAAVMTKSAPLVAHTIHARHAETGAVLGKIGQPYASREQQLEAEAAIIRKVEGYIGDTVAITVVIEPSVLKHLCSVKDILADVCDSEEGRVEAIAAACMALNGTSTYIGAGGGGVGGGGSTYTTPSKYTSGSTAYNKVESPPNGSVSTPTSQTRRLLVSNTLIMRPVTPSRSVMHEEGTAEDTTRIGGIGIGDKGGGSIGGLSTGLTTLKSPPPPLLVKTRETSRISSNVASGAGIGGGSSVGAGSGISAACTKRSLSPPNANQTGVSGARRASLASHASSSPRSTATRATNSTSNAGSGGGPLPTVRSSVLNLVRNAMSYNELMAFNTLQSLPGTIHNNSEHRHLIGYDPRKHAEALRASLPKGVDPHYAANFFTPDLDEMVAGREDQPSSAVPPPLNLGTVLIPANATIHQALAIIFIKLLMHRSSLGLYRTIVASTVARDTYVHADSSSYGRDPSLQIPNDASFTSFPTAVKGALLREMGDTSLVTGDVSPPPVVSFLSPNSPFLGASDHPLSALFASLRLGMGALGTSTDAENKNWVGGAEVTAGGPRVSSLDGVVDYSKNIFTDNKRERQQQNSAGSQNSFSSSSATSFFPARSRVAYLARVIPEALDSGATIAGGVGGMPSTIQQPYSFVSSSSSSANNYTATFSNVGNTTTTTDRKYNPNATDTSSAASSIYPMGGVGPQGTLTRQLEADLAVVVTAVASSSSSGDSTNAKVLKQKRLAAHYRAIAAGREKGGGKRGLSSSSSLVSGKGSSGGGPPAHLAAQMAASASLTAAHMAQQSALSHLSTTDPSTLDAMSHLLLRSTQMLLSTGFFTMVPSAYVPPTAQQFLSAYGDGRHQQMMRVRGGVRRVARGGLGTDSGVSFLSSIGDTNNNHVNISSSDGEGLPRRLFGIHQQKNAQIFRPSSSSPLHAAGSPKTKEEQQTHRKEDDQYEGGGLGCLVDPYHNPNTIPIPVVIASRPLLRTLLKKCLSQLNKQEQAKDAANVAAAARQQAAEATSAASMASQRVNAAQTMMTIGGSAGGGEAYNGTLRVDRSAVLSPLNKYPVTSSTAQQLQQRRQQGILQASLVGPQQPPSPLEVSMSPTTGGRTFNNSNVSGTNSGPKPAAAIAKILPEATVISALGPPYVLSVDVPSIWEALFTVQDAEAKHRRMIERRYLGVALPYYTSYHYHCVMREGVLRQALREMEARAWESLLADSLTSLGAAERSTLERAEEERREVCFAAPYERLSRHLWPMLLERLHCANMAFLRRSADVCEQERRAFDQTFAQPTAPYSKHQLRALATVARQRSAFLATCDDTFTYLERESLSARRNLLSQATTVLVRGRMRANGEDIAAAALL